MERSASTSVNALRSDPSVMAVEMLLERLDGRGLSPADRCCELACGDGGAHYQRTNRCSGKIETQGSPGGTVIGSPEAVLNVKGSATLLRSQVPVTPTPW